MPTSTNQDCLYICKKPALAINNQQFNGNMNNSSKTRAMRYSEIVRYNGSRYGQMVYISNPNANNPNANNNGICIAPPRNRF
jgi:hypothetical protein